MGRESREVRNVFANATSAIVTVLLFFFFSREVAVCFELLR